MSAPSFVLVFHFLVQQGPGLQPSVVDRALAQPGTSSIEALRALQTQAGNAFVTAALQLSIAQQIEKHRGPGQALDALSSLRPPGPLKSLLAEERLRLARAAGRHAYVIRVLQRRLANATRRQRSSRVRDLAGYVIDTHQARFFQDAASRLSPELDTSWLALFDLERALNSPRRIVLRQAIAPVARRVRSAAPLQTLVRMLSPPERQKSFVATASQIEITRLCRRFLQAGMPQTCLDWLQARRFTIDVRLLQMRALAATRRSQQALDLIEELRADPAFAYRPEYELERARLLSRLGLSNQAQAAYATFARSQGATREADEAAFFVAWIDHEGGHAAQAVARFQHYLQRRPQAPMAPLATWLLAVNQLRLQRYGDARITLEQVLAKPASAEVATAARYQRALTLRALGHIDEAAKELDAMIQDPLRPAMRAPYYRALAQTSRQQLNQQAGALAPLCGSTVTTEGAGTARLSWVDEKRAPPSRFASCGPWLRRRHAALSAALEPRFDAALGALALTASCGLYARLLKRVPVPTELGAQRAYLQALAATGDHTRTLRLASRLYRRQLQRPPLPQERWIWALAYPQPSAYHDRQRRDLLLAVGRHESHFMPAVISRVGAIGLMQIMPHTGQRLAALGDETLEPQSLKNPSLNLHLAARYLDLLDQEFNGERVLMTASYNAGPHNVRQWLGNSPGLPLALFVETIPFRETRGYVKKVLSAQIVYRWLLELPPLDLTPDASCMRVQPRYAIDF